MASRKRSSKKVAAKSRKKVAKKAPEKSARSPPRARRRSRRSSRRSPLRSARRSDRRSTRRKTARTIRRGLRLCGTMPCCSARTSRLPGAHTKRRREAGRSARRRCRCSRRWRIGGPTACVRTTSAERSASRSTTRAFARRSPTIRISSISPAPTQCSGAGRSSRSSPSSNGARRSGSPISCRIPATTSTIARAASLETPTRSSRRCTRVPGRTILCMETTAGSGTAIGATFEDLAELMAAVPEPLRSRIGVCVDSCHVYSAGYDLGARV